MSRTTAESRSAVCCGSFLAEKPMRAAAARELSRAVCMLVDGWDIAGEVEPALGVLGGDGGEGRAEGGFQRLA
jgi:hypothetical protein